MGRPRKFDEEAVLDRAMELFWRQGYEATSLDDLLAAMGIGRQSLYNTFGDKRRLFLKSIDHYRQTRVCQSLERLERAGATIDDLTGFFDSVVQMLSTSSFRRACLIVNTTMELGPHDEEVAQKIRAHLEQCEAAFFNVLQAARESGDLMTAHKPRALARHFANTVMGLHVLSKGGAEKAEMIDVVQVALSVLNDGRGASSP